MNPNNLRIALIEDSPDDEEMSLRAIHAAGVPCEVRVSRDGEAGLRDLGLRGGGPFGLPAPPDLIVCDYKLPVFNGEAVLRFVRADPRFDHVPFVVYTSSDDESAIDRCLSAGASAYLVKPIDYLDYVACLREVVKSFAGGGGHADGRSSASAREENAAP